jgi:hypothetical protein
MNWDAIGAIGEIVGAIAVLATLIYLAIQIRQNSAIQRAQTHQQLALERVNGVRLITTNKELRDAVGKARFGKPLTEDEQGILFWMTVMHLREYENELYQHSQGMIEDDELEVQKNIVGVFPYADRSCRKNSVALVHTENTRGNTRTGTEKKPKVAWGGRIANKTMSCQAFSNRSVKAIW